MEPTLRKKAPPSHERLKSAEAGVPGRRETACLVACESSSGRAIHRSGDVATVALAVRSSVLRRQIRLGEA